MLDALFEARMAPINERRLAILDEAGGARDASLRALVRALVHPLVASLDLRPASTYYGRFLAAYLASPGAGDRFTALGEPVLEGLQDVTAGIFRHLAEVPEPVRNHRVQLAGDMVVAAVAGFERDRDRGDAATTPALLAAMLVDSIVGMLRAPVTATTSGLVRALHDEEVR
jgi:hypothetical protein